MLIRLTLILILSVLLTPSVEAKKKQQRYKPYLMTTATTTDYDLTVTDIRKKIESSPFELAGEYSPYENAHVFALTHTDLLKAASEGEHGGYGAVIRLSVTKVDQEVQVAYVNPTYMTNLYHIPEVSSVSALLKTTFGESEGFGSKRGKSRKALKGYQYMMFMPEFEDHDKLGSFNSYQHALEVINANLASGELQLNKVFEVAIPGKEETLFGVAILDGDGGDKNIMSVIDTADNRHTAHLPYAVLVSGDKAYALAGKFRIASAFPDLSMGTFMDISEAPDAIKDILSKLTKH